MKTEVLREFIQKYPELCNQCWACSGTGKIRRPGHLDWVDCYECHQLGQLPSTVKMVDYLLSIWKPQP